MSILPPLPLVTYLRGALKAVETSSGANRLGVPARLLHLAHEVLGFDASRPKLLRPYSIDGQQGCSCFQPIQRFCRKLLHLEKFLKMSKVAVPLAMADDIMGDILGNPRQLG